MAYTARSKDDPGDVGRAADQQASVDNDAFFRAALIHVQLEPFSFAIASACTTGDGKSYLPIPLGLDGLSLIGIHGEVETAGVTTTMDVQVHNITQAVDMLSTKLTWDSTETGTDTAATPAVIKSNGDEVVAAYDVLRLDFDSIHTTPATGCIVTLRFG